MKQNIVFVAIDDLKTHERVNKTRLACVRKCLREEGVIRRPVIVEKSSGVILDGHHRVQALRELGAVRVPVAYVRYSDRCVRVYMRRKNILMKLIKQAVIEMALTHRKFPSKTTRHLIENRPTMKAVALTQLQEAL